MDSFIWGAGVIDSVIWTNLLVKELRLRNINAEILNWGKSGWSTKQQFNFFRNYGYNYEFDYLIFAFVVNDPIMDSSTHKQFFWPGGCMDRNVIVPAAHIFPNFTSFITDLWNNFLASISDYGYVKWLESKVYTNKNLKSYKILISEIDSYCKMRGIKYMFIMTPENHSELLGKYFDKIEKIFKKEKIPYINLFPQVKTNLSEYSVRNLWANPGDGHPGYLVTSLYAKVVADSLVGILKP